MLYPSSSRPGVLVSPALEGIPGLVHGFTTRALGSAAGPGSPAASSEDAVSRALGPDAERWTRREAEQVHGAAVAGPEGFDVPVAADALVTRMPGDLLVVRTADCLPVLVASAGARGIMAMAAVHCGWRGLVAGVLETALERLLAAAAPGARMVAALGPCIGPCCFEVGPEVAHAMSERFGSTVTTPGRGDRSHADLAAAARQVLALHGASCPDQDVPPCTMHAPESFHSHRGQGAAAGRMAAFCGFLPA